MSCFSSRNLSLQLALRRDERNDIDLDHYYIYPSPVIGLGVEQRRLYHAIRSYLTTHEICFVIYVAVTNTCVCYITDEIWLIVFWGSSAQSVEYQSSFYTWGLLPWSHHMYACAQYNREGHVTWTPRRLNFFSTACSGWKQRDQWYAFLNICKEIHRWPVVSPHKGSLKRNVFPCHYAIIMVTHAVWCYVFAQGGTHFL